MQEAKYRKARNTLANIKSQIKRNKQNEKRRINNRNVRGASRTAVNQARASLVENTPETRQDVLKAISALDKAAEKGVIHKNAAARRKGRLMKKLSSLKPAETSAETPKTR